MARVRIFEMPMSVRKRENTSHVFNFGAFELCILYIYYIVFFFKNLPPFGTRAQKSVHPRIFFFFQFEHVRRAVCSENPKEKRARGNSRRAG